MRLIDADALHEMINWTAWKPPFSKKQVRWFIDNTPSADVAERKKGKWIDMGDFEQCSVCTGTHLKTVNTVYGKAIWIKSAYCPNCGARMLE